MPSSYFAAITSVQDPNPKAPAEPLAWVARVQGLYFLFTGVWPLLDIFTFQVVTGPKMDLWLVKTVGALVAVIGAVIALAGLRRRLSSEIGLLAAGSSAALLGIDLLYVARHRISPIYLLDAVIEITFVTLWVLFSVVRLSWNTPRSNAATTHTSASAALADRTDYRFVARRTLPGKY